MNPTPISWGQSYYFYPEQIQSALSNVQFIETKINELEKKKFKDQAMKDKQRSHIDRLIMSKDCIEYYYKLE